MTENYTELNFRTNEWGQLVLRMPDGAEEHGVEPVRCFPLSDPDRMISVVDAEGHEQVMLPSLEVLNPVAREILHRELAEREFAPEIQRITATSVANPPCRWDVITDRGATSFQLESDDDIRRLGKTGAVIADANGIRYKIPDIAKLDSHSQGIIRRLI